MRRLAQLLLNTLLLAVAVSTTVAASVFQLDVCNKHRTVSDAPGTSLTVTKDGMCVLTSQVLSLPASSQRSCGASRQSTAVVLRFPCVEQPRLKQASGPALNVWGSFDGTPQPTRKGMVVTEAAPAKPAVVQQDTDVAVAAAQNGTKQDAPVVSGCNFLTVNPGLYYHKAPPMFTYGYVVNNLPCEPALSARATVAALEQAGAKTFPTTYSLWLKPTLPAPPAGMSSEAQTCNLVVSVLLRSYVSKDTFPCSMKALAPEELEDGCCYNAAGAGRRRLLSRWELSMAYRRAMLLL